MAEQRGVDAYGRNPGDQHHLKVDLVEQLLSKGVVRPESVAGLRDDPAWFDA